MQESGVGEIEIEDEGMRVSVRRADEAGAVAAPLAALPDGTDAELPAPGRGDDARRVADGRRLLPLVVAREAPRSSRSATSSRVGQTLCLLEAMKLFNELKAEQEGRVRAIHVENGQPVEFGQLLFELEPVDTQPIV